jgi:glycosyltransferase involved in cell wall biosynthesis
MSSPQLSVALCTYNGAPHLRKQLDSLLRQTRRPDEVVVGDDDSSDGTWELLEDFQRRAESRGVRVRMHRNERNLGFVTNFSQTLSRTEGQLVFLCDQDDVWQAEKIAVLAERFEADADLLLLFSDARLVDASGAPLGHTLFEALELTSDERASFGSDRAFDVLLRRSAVTGATAAFRREMLGLGLPVGQGWIHDEWLAIVTAAVGRVGLVDRELIDYRQHAGNQIGMRKRTVADKWRELARSRQPELLAEVSRLAELHARLATHAGLAQRLRAVERKQAHFERRVALGRMPRPIRFGAVLREAMRGDYGRFGTGGRSMLRDLMRRD